MTTAAPQPNILWVVTTQWRAQATGYAGDPNARTPSLDALAARSVNYTQAVTPHPFGPFARAAMLTGVLSPENGVQDYFDPLPPAADTIAHRLWRRGYATAFFGKWHLGVRDQASPLVGEEHARIVVPPEARGGFDFWEGFESGFLLNDPWLHGTRLPAPVQVRGYQSDVVCGRAALGFGRSGQAVRDGRPWYCMVSLEAPHPPYDAPAAGVVPRDPRDIVLPSNVPRGGEIEAKARRELAGYYAHIEATDRAIGRLLEAAQRESAEAGTPLLIVFTSVHGDMHGAHGYFRKGWPHEESVRVPLLVCLPGGRAETRDDAISLVDLPWLMESWLGHRVLPRVAVEAAHISMPSVVALPQQCDRVWHGRRSKTQKRIFNADGSLWLDFDLQADPTEMANLAQRGPP